MRITVLMENSSPDHLLHEHGLSLHLSHRGHSFLLDGGASGRFVQNAERLGIDLMAVEAAILSHGHYDHANGLDAFLALHTRAPVYARPGIWEESYFGTGEARRYIGVSPHLRDAYASRFDLFDGPREISPGLHLIPDQAPGEQSLVAETDSGLVVLNSCCHAGGGYIVQDILTRFPGQHVRALIGGLHLMGSGGLSTLGVSPGIVKNLARWLTDELGVEEICTGHCTGSAAFRLLQAERPGQVRPLHTGDVLEY